MYSLQMSETQSSVWRGGSVHQSLQGHGWTTSRVNQHCSVFVWATDRINVAEPEPALLIFSQSGFCSRKHLDFLWSNYFSPWQTIKNRPSKPKVHQSERKSVSFTFKSLSFCCCFVLRWTFVILAHKFPESKKSFCHRETNKVTFNVTSFS